MNYTEFINNKRAARKLQGFKPVFLPSSMFDFQAVLAEWIIRIGKGAIFASCGLGKSLLELVYAENVHRHTNKNVLLLTPLAVAQQMVREGEKFGIEVHKTRNGKVYKGINVTNYQQLHHYSASDFICIIGDELSVIKNADGVTRKMVTEYMNQVPYNMGATATPAPNDFMELGTIAEALGAMGRNQMLGMFFTNDGETTQAWRLKGHAKRRFWQWVSTWARAIRKPSDLGFDDARFILPPLHVHKSVVASRATRGFLPDMAKTLGEQRQAKRETLKERCERVVEVLPRDRPCIAWAHLNAEADLLEEILPDAVQVSGSMDDKEKEERLNEFSLGNIRTLVTKPKIACFGLNWQHCADIAYFPDHSEEQYYQAIRRNWRFGQEKEVNCHLVYSEKEGLVVANMLRKERQTEELYDGIVRYMLEAEKENKQEQTNGRVEVPEWLRTYASTPTKN